MITSILQQLVALFFILLFLGIGYSFIRGFVDGWYDRVNGRPFNDKNEK